MQDVIRLFPDEASCCAYLARLRWGDDGFLCPSCSNTSCWRYKSGRIRCAKCRADTSIIAGTVFEDTHLPLRLWLLAIWCVVSQKQGISALGLSRALGISRQKTGWQLLGNIRRGMVRLHRNRLSGIVEVDEILLGGKRHKFEGRSPQGKTLVLVAAEDKGKRGIGRIRMRIILDATATSLRPAVAAMVEPGSTVRTDGWKGYHLGQWGYRHLPIKQQPGDDATPLIHRVSSLLKRWLLGTHQGGVQVAHLQPYLDEFVFRFNRRTSRSRGLLFYRLLENLVQAPFKGKGA